MALTKVKASNITLSTPAASSNDTTPATTAYVTTALANMVDSAPSTLNTLNELAAALGDDANFSTTVTNNIATKLPLTGGTLTGALTMNVSPTVNNARLLVQRANDDSSIAFANNASGTPSSNTWAIGYDHSASNGFAIAYSASGIPSLTGNNLIQIDTSGQLGIGASPASGLHLTGGNNTASKLTLTNTAPSPDNTWSIHPIYNGQDLLIQEDGTTRFTFKEGGDFFVGSTTDRGRKFVVEGTGDLMALYSTNAGAGGAQLDLIHDSASYADGDSVGIVNFSTDDYQLGSIKTVATNSDKGRFHIGVRKSSSAYNHNAFQLTNAGDEIYADIYSPSGSNRGAGYFRFKTDGGSTEESVAQIYMEQGSGDGGSRKCNMYFQVSDNGNPSTALTIHNNKNLQAATGISFGSNTASNYILHTYEEGNFAPIFACAGGSAPSSQSGTGQYTRIGDVVYLTGQITWSGGGSGGSNLRIAIPFNVISDARAGMAIGLNSGVSYTSGHSLHLIPEINTNVIYIVSSPSNGTGHDHLNFSNVTNSGSRIFSFSGCYHTRD